jgi:hypothetical protein
MTTKTKIILSCAGLLLISGVVYVFSQDARRKRYDNTVVPPEYALKLIKK